MLDPIPTAAAAGPVAFAGAALGAAPFLTFLFTDIEGSTRLWEEHADVMGPALAAHDRLLRGAVEAAGGSVVKMTGDGMLATFQDPRAAVGAALAGQRALATASAASSVLRVRMALHAGPAEVRDGDVFGPSINRVSRILSTGHGGQMLLSASAALLVRDRLPQACELVDLGTHRLRDLDRPEQLFQLVTPDLPRDFPPLRSLNNRRTNLPAQLTSFVGREHELAEVATLLSRHRLVTLIGTGGTGKTRLMLEAAGRLGDRFPDGVWLAELAPLGDPSQVASEVARALGAPEVPGVPAMAIVTAFVADKELLLLLDNAEHLVDGVAGVAGRLLAAAPRLHIITTSREALAVPGEAVLQLQSLSCPGAGLRPGGISIAVPDLADAASTEAVQLFMERATAVDPGFKLGTANVAAVSEICRRLDGIPLAIELAAARVSAMSADDIALRLGDRFRLLAGGRRTSVPRQQTLHALIDWSWDLLNDDDRRLLRRLSIFSGGWTAQAAARIVSDGTTSDEVALIDGLTRLVDRSLLIVDRGSTTRYRMLETIRQYAREKLIEAGEVSALGDRHFAAFAALAREAQPHLMGPMLVDWLDRLDADADNLGAALEWGLEAEPWEAIRMATAMQTYWGVRVASADDEARIVAAVEIARARAVHQPAADVADMAAAASLLGSAAMAWAQSGRASIAIGWAKEAVPLARASGDDRAMLFATIGRTMAEVFLGTSANLRFLFEEATAWAEKTGAQWAVAMSAGFAGTTLWELDRALAEALLVRAEKAARESGSPLAIGSVSMAHGRALGKAGRTDDAVAHFATAIARFAEIGAERSVLAGRSDMAHALRRGGRLDEAEALYRETIGGWVRLGHRGAVANQLENIAFVAIARGRAERAARLLGAAEAMREAANASMAFDEVPELTANIERLRTLGDRATIDSWWALGRATSMADAVALAVSE